MLILFFLSFFLQAGVKGKLGRLLGIFEVRYFIYFIKISFFGGAGEGVECLQFDSHGEKTKQLPCNRVRLKLLSVTCLYFCCAALNAAGRCIRQVFFFCCYMMGEGLSKSDTQNFSGKSVSSRIKKTNCGLAAAQ